MCRGGGTGRRAGFKIRFPHGSAGSIPALGTILNAGFKRFSEIHQQAKNHGVHTAHIYRTGVCDSI